MNHQDLLDAEGVKNMELVNKMKAYQDPLLAEFDKDISSKTSP